MLSELNLPFDLICCIASMLPSADLLKPHLYRDNAARRALSSRFTLSTHPSRDDAYKFFFSLFKPYAPHYFHYTNENALDLAIKCIACGADINAENSYDLYGDRSTETPLHLAACYGKTKLAELLLEHGADVNSLKTCNGVYTATPLHWAACRGHTDTVRLLIRHGANVNAQNSNIMTPADTGVGNRNSYDTAAAVNVIMDNGGVTTLGLRHRLIETSRGDA